MIIQRTKQPGHIVPSIKGTLCDGMRLFVFIVDEIHALGSGDMFTVPAEIPYTIRMVTDHVRLVSFFTHCVNTYQVHAQLNSIPGSGGCREM